VSSVNVHDNSRMSHRTNKESVATSKQQGTSIVDKDYLKYKLLVYEVIQAVITSTLSRQLHCDISLSTHCHSMIIVATLRQSHSKIS